MKALTDSILALAPELLKSAVNFQIDLLLISNPRITWGDLATFSLYSMHLTVLGLASFAVSLVQSVSPGFHTAKEEKSSH